MTNQERDPDVVADAVVETRSRPSIVWLIPLIAVLVGAFVAYRAISDRGPQITISFKTASGLEAGKTKIKYKDVEIGVVESVELSHDLTSVICRARMVKGAEEYLREKSQFWVVEPRIAGGQVTGLTTLLSGAYIGADPVREGKHSRRFVGLEEPPVITAEVPGRFFELRSTGAGAVSVGSPVFFRRIEVGRVVSSQLDPSDDFVTTRIFVKAPFDQRVHDGTRFWNASGIDASLSASGVKINTESLISILIGGIAFDTPEHETHVMAAENSVFPLYESRAASEARHYSKSVAYLLYFDDSVRGLTVGAPVEFRGIQVGQVTDVTLEFDPTLERFRIPVTIEIQPERFTTIEDEDDAPRGVRQSGGFRHAGAAQERESPDRPARRRVRHVQESQAGADRLDRSDPGGSDRADPARGDHGQRGGSGRSAQPFPGGSDRQGAERVAQGAARHAGGGPAHAGLGQLDDRPQLRREGGAGARAARAQRRGALARARGGADRVAAGFPDLRKERQQAMRSSALRARLAAALLTALATGCLGSSPAPEFYTLSPASGAASGSALASLPELGLVVGPLDFPRYLDRPEIVTRDGSHRLVLADAHRWGGSLRSDILRVVADDLGRLLGTSRVAIYPAEPRFPAAFRLLLDLREFEGVPGGNVVLRMRWTIASTQDGRALAVEESRIEQPVGSTSFDALVAAESAALGTLNRQIAERMAALPAS